MKVKGSILVMLVGALLVPAFAFAADAPAAGFGPGSRALHLSGGARNG